MTDGRDELTDLVARMNAGEQKAGDELFARLYARQVYLARLMLGTFPDISRNHDPESFVHQGWIDLRTALKSQKPENPQRYLGLLALKIRCALLDIAAKERRKRDKVPLAQDMSDAGQSALALEPLADSSCEPGRLEIWTRFHEAVNDLPDALREVFSLHFYTSATQAEIANILGLSPRTVGRLLAKAKDQLVERLGGLGEWFS